ncbi:glycosyltransferase [Thermochromatium tepidum]|uniref:Glycosyltransferase n=1 Tax=Thermochromatium tepidum ATCC 43061 TaxID=316276 RepID=A0A6I6E0T4_THETI|nr:glycosyltransferase [Thermochromatium tepidum]QGU33474.1 glycosyltransferase [Thermochromatium tepidum ATCC 43061]
MKILLITHGEPLDPGRIASGNSVRARGLALGLSDAGHTLVQVYPATLGGPPPRGVRAGLRARSYRDRDALTALIAEEAPDALLVGYWELIELLPESLDLPLILDVVAPRILEAMYQEHLDLADEVRRTLLCYRRADRFLVGNQRQASFLLPWLLLAGFDCRVAAPIDVVPISAGFECLKPLTCSPETRLRLVTGGVSWPWRRTEDWLDALVWALDRQGRGRAGLVVLSGRYVYDADQAPLELSESERAWPESIVERHGLLPYGAMREYLRRTCHIGLELADENPERWHSQSFRAMEFLSLGLPLICNRYTELAGLVCDYDAGWVIDRIEDIDGLVTALLARPETIAEKSANALRLVEERFHYGRTIQPVLDFLATPVRACPGAPLIDLKSTAPAVPPRADQSAAAPCEPSIQTPVARVLPRGSARFKALARTALGQARPWLKPLVTTLMRGLGRLGRRRAVILVSRSDIHPANHGAAVKIERTAWGLSFAVEAVYLISEDRVRYHEVRQGQWSERRFPLWLQLLGPDPEQVRAFLLDSGIPAEDAFLYRPVADWSFIARTLYLALITGARVYQAEFPAYGRATCWTRDLLGGRALLVEHNVEYRRLAEQVPDLSPHGYEVLRKVELGWCKRSDAVVVVSESDRQRLLADGVAPERLHLIPHGVDLEAFARAAPLDLRALYAIPPECAVLVYHGIYLYPPNLEAMKVMADEILPRLEQLGVAVRVLAIGPHPPANELHPSLRFTGPVESVAPYLKGADLAVVPLQKGGGTRMKILDYFAAGLAVVSTAKGAEGIPITPGVEALIVDDHDAFAQAVAELLADPERRAHLGAAARAFVTALDWRTIAARYLELVDSG